MTDYLSATTLANLPAAIARPSYARDQVTIGIVHFGISAFHRVHQAWYVDRLLAHDPRFGICAVSLRSTDAHDALAAQQGLYTLVEREVQSKYRVIGAIKETLVAPQNPLLVLERLAAPSTRLVTITVTEKGYCLRADGTLDLDHADIRNDLRTPEKPCSLIGYLVAGLARRRDAGHASVCVISCDNLVDNGGRLARAVIALAQLRDPALAAWIEAHTTFPRTMVDSITPATTDALKEEVCGALGMRDRWPVQRELFTQWVLQRVNMADGPDWASVGVTLTDDVPAYERAKLRLLNGAHSTLAYLGLLAGFDTVAQAMADTRLAAFVETMMHRDILPTLSAPPGMDLDAYIAAVAQRFRNPAMRHQLAQIAWDGSQKIPFRLLGTIADNIAARRSIRRLCVALAAWLHFLRIRAAAGVRVIDPLAEALFEVASGCTNVGHIDIPRFLSLDAIFPPAMATDTKFQLALANAYDNLASAKLPDATVLDALQTYVNTI